MLPDGGETGDSEGAIMLTMTEGAAVVMDSSPSADLRAFCSSRCCITICVASAAFLKAFILLIGTDIVALKPSPGPVAEGTTMSAAVGRRVVATTSGRMIVAVDGDLVVEG